MYGGGPPRDDMTQLRQALEKLQHEKGEADGMLQILNAKLDDAKEENFDLRAEMATFQAETRYQSEQNEKTLQAKVQALESQLAFQRAQLQNAERAKLRALKEADDLQQKQEKQLLERKKLDAEKRLLATKRRKQESFLAASQSMLSQSMLSQQQQPQAVRPLATPVTDTAVQTELKMADKEYGSLTKLKEENASLVSSLLTSLSRDLLTLLNGTAPSVVNSDKKKKSEEDEDRTQPHGSHSFTASQYFQSSSGASLSDSMHQSSSGGVPFSQSVFSQLAERTSAQARASLLSATMESNATQISLATDRARELYDVIGRMLAGEVTAVALAPVITKYLAGPTDLNCSVLCSVFRFMYSVIHYSVRFQQFLLVGSSPDSTRSTSGTQTGFGAMRHPRISFPGLRFASLDDYLLAQRDSDAVEPSTAETEMDEIQLRSKLMSALCRVIKNNLKEAAVVKDGLSVLSCWVNLGFSHRPPLRPDFKPLLTSNMISAILLTPKGPSDVKAQAIGLLSELLRIPDVFTEVEAEPKKSLLFNRCAKMLVCNGRMSTSEEKDLRMLQHQVVKMLISIITSHPSGGFRFVLESTRGLPSDSDGHQAITYCLAELLHQETFRARTTGGAKAEAFMRDLPRINLVRDALALLGLLSRYVDVHRELDGDDKVQTFLAVLSFLSNLDGARSDQINANARALIATMN